ncbi:hypothetical protein [Peribacillus frigoritolerans]|uniref:hypothetical protein n=1 Tax=Peribacillus frigoritolerans TaxID=450367 RepID=UPI003F80282B
MKFVSFILSIVFMFCIYVPVHAQQSPFTVKQKQAIDLNGDGRKEVVELFARKSQYYETGWKLVVDGKDVADFDSNGTYILAEMKFDDLLQDGKPGILLYFETGSSGGTERLVIFKKFENQFKQIFDNPVHRDKHRFSTKYLGNFKVEFIDKKTGMKGIIPINPKERYPDFSLKQADEHLKNMIKDFVDPASNYRIENVGGNKPKDIITMQRVSGIAHVDEIARFETRYSFDNKNQKYVPAKVSLYSYDAKKHVAEKPYN